MYIIFYVSLLMFILGLLVSKGKQYWLISGYNMYSKAQKSKVDIENLAREIAYMCYILGMLFLLSALASILKQEILGTIGFFLIFPVIFFFFFLFRIQRYDNNSKNPDGSMKKSTLFILIGVGIILLLIITPIMILSLKDYSVQIEDSSLKISAFMGDIIPFNNILNITLSEDITIKGKVNGSDVGEIKRGLFNTKEYDISRVYINSNSPPFIVIKTIEKYYILNKKMRKKL